MPRRADSSDGLLKTRLEFVTEPLHVSIQLWRASLQVWHDCWSDIGVLIVDNHTSERSLGSFQFSSVFGLTWTSLQKININSTEKPSCPICLVELGSVGFDEHSEVQFDLQRMPISDSVCLRRQNAHRWQLQLASNCIIQAKQADRGS